MEPALPPPNNSFTLFRDLCEANDALKSAESLRDPQTEAKRAETCRKGIDFLCSPGSLNPETVKKMAEIGEATWQSFRKSTPGLEGKFRKGEQDFLHVIGKSVVYLCKSGTPINWEANADRMIKALSKQLETCSELGYLTAKLGGSSQAIWDASILRLIVQDLEGHKDQFSTTFFNCPKVVVEDAKIKAPTQPKKTSEIHKSLPQHTSTLKFHSIFCLGSYQSLRAAIDAIQATDVNQTGNDKIRSIENPEIKSMLIQFAESFKMAKIMGMQNSAEASEFGIAYNLESIRQIRTMLAQDGWKAKMLERVEAYKNSPEYKALSGENADIGINTFIVSRSYQAYNEYMNEKKKRESQTP